MTYNVSGGTLNVTQPANLWASKGLRVKPDKASSDPCQSDGCSVNS